MGEVRDDEPGGKGLKDMTIIIDLRQCYAFSL